MKPQSKLNHTQEMLISDLEDLEAGNVKHANEEVPASLCVQSLVDSQHQPLEHPLVHGL